MYSWKSKDKEHRMWAHSVIGLIPVLALVFWWFVHNGKARQFKKIVRPIQSACQEMGGCPSIPKGWRFASCVEKWRQEEEFFSDQKHCASLKADSRTFYYYTADSKKYLIEWHYISSSKLIAKGGTKKSLVITKYYQGKEEAVIYEEEAVESTH